MDFLLKCAATLLLTVQLGVIIWAVTHIHRIKRTLIADEALPKPGPAGNILVLLITVLGALTALLIVFLFH